MSVHVKHFLLVVGAAVGTAVPPLLADPAVKHFVMNHPAIAIYYPLVLALVSTLARARSKRNGA